MFKLMGSRPIEGYHLCSSEFLAIADHDIVHLKVLNYTISEEKKKKNSCTKIVNYKKTLLLRLGKLCLLTTMLLFLYLEFNETEILQPNF